MKHNDETIAIRDQLMEFADNNNLVAASVLIVYNVTCRTFDEVRCRKAMVFEVIDNFHQKLGWDVWFTANVETSRRRTLLGAYAGELDAINRQIQKSQQINIGDVQNAVEQLKNIDAKLALDLNSEKVSIFECR